MIAAAPPPKPAAVRRGGRIRPRVARGGIALLSSAVAVVSCRYLAGKGPIPSTVAANRHLHPWITLHAAGAATALLIGPWQFSPALRTRRASLHRLLGRLYVAGCASGGGAALVLAAGVSSGPIAGAGFAVLGLAWLSTTSVAVRRIAERQMTSHRRWMIRSFSLTFSAVTLRIYLPISGTLGLDPITSYRAVAWLCWVPNLLLAELYLSGARATTPYEA